MDILIYIKLHQLMSVFKAYASHITISSMKQQSSLI